MGRKNRDNKMRGGGAGQPRPAKDDTRGESSKRSLVQQGKKGSRGTMVALGIAAAAIVVAALVIFGGGGGSPFQVVGAEAGMVRIPLADFEDGHAHFYTYRGAGRGAGRDINFFVLKSSDGVVRAAFDACDVCFREKKGYRQEGDLMVCNNCGQRFPSVKINEIRGGCNPAPLDRQVQDRHLVVRASDIEQGGGYF